MYTQQQASKIRQQFWTHFGQYMRPVPGANGKNVNWLNYKTGIKDIYFRMDADATRATIGVELQHSDPALRKFYFDQFNALRSFLHHELGEEWEWQEDCIEEYGKSLSYIRLVLESVNIFKETDWPKIISFLKPRIIGLDRFWNEMRIQFEN